MLETVCPPLRRCGCSAATKVRVLRCAAMVLVLPDQGAFDAVEQSVFQPGASDVMTGSEAKTISLRLPRFKFDLRMSARLLLGELGMIDAFSDEADFSGMDGTPGLSIADVLQKAFISVDEQGTEAAAATAVISGTPSVPVIEEQLTFDRPFLFEIRERTTGTVLFAGRVMNPAK